MTKSCWFITPIVIALFCVKVALSACPADSDPNYYQDDNAGKCMVLVKKTFTFETGEAYCNELGGHLVSWHSDADWTSLQCWCFSQMFL